MKVAYHSVYGGWILQGPLYAKLEQLGADKDFIRRVKNLDEDCGSPLRSDPLLIRAIEELPPPQTKDLTIEELPDDAVWSISECDGKETLSWQHRHERIADLRAELARLEQLDVQP